METQFVSIIQPIAGPYFPMSIKSRNFAKLYGAVGVTMIDG
jgi:hypothetical protein